MAASEMENSSWKQLANQKEKEWRNVLESRVEELEKSNGAKDSLLATEKSKFKELKEHFKYNLRLLEDRDRELEKYDVTITEFRTNLNAKNAEISELKIHLDDLKGVIQREEKARVELQSNYQRRLKERQIEVDTYKSVKDNEVQDERKEYEQFRRNLQRHLTNVQNELDTQKRELTTEFENALKKREHEFKLQTDELNNKVMEHELKVKLLEKELELVRDASDKTVAAVEAAEAGHYDLEKLLKQKEWELADITAMKDAQITEISQKLSSTEAAMKKMQEDFQRKYSIMDKDAREKEENLERVKNGYFEREQALKGDNQDLLSKLEDAQIKERQLTWAKEDLVKEKEMHVERLQEEVNEVKRKWDQHVQEISRDNVNRDLELTTALEEQRRLKQELDQRKEDLGRYKNELKLASEREEKLDKGKAQVELDWQRRLEDVESQQYEKSEDLIKRLTNARNEADALVRERERELKHKILLVKSLHRERDQLRSVLKEHGIPLDNFAKYSLDEMESGEVSYLEDLQSQNASLKKLIGQMRQEMEGLGKDTATTPADESSRANEYYKGRKDAEERVLELQRENRILKDKLNSAIRRPQTTIPSLEKNEAILSQLESNSSIKTHILSLNEAIGSLRSEKVDFAATVKKQQARIAYLDASLEDMSKQPRLKQIQIDQLNYEINALKRRNESETTGLRNRVTELELLLSEARREADEYHRASLERNQELVTLGNQLSAMKMEMAETNPSINFGAQELYIQQLQNELTQLRKRSSALEMKDLDGLGSKMSNADENLASSDYKIKLKSAAAKIVQLAKENQQLMESNNRLRAELKSKDDQSKGERKLPDQYQVEKMNNNVNNKEHVVGRLSQLEDLQYQLTRQELQFAHRFNVRETDPQYNMAQSGKVGQDEIPQREISVAKLQSEGSDQSTSNHMPKPEAVTSLRSPRSAKSGQQKDMQVLMSMSSGGGDSIQKVWQMLDDSGTSTPISPRSALMANERKQPDETYFPVTDDNPFVIEGRKASASSRKTKDGGGRLTATDFSQKIKKPSLSKAKIRNYNNKEDKGYR